MLVVVWENNYDRWHALHAFGIDPANKGKKQPIMNGKYTTVDDGQKEFGGWSEEGLERYNEVKKKIGAHLKDPSRQSMEKNILKKLRAKYKIECVDADLEKRLAKQRKKRELTGEAGTALQPPAKKANTRTFDFGYDDF